MKQKAWKLQDPFSSDKKNGRAQFEQNLVTKAKKLANISGDIYRQGSSRIKKSGENVKVSC